MTTHDEPLTYAGYLGLDAVLGAGRAVTDTLAEAHFIAAHQAIELRFKVIIASMREAIRDAHSGWTDEAVRPLQRVAALLHGALFDMEILHQSLTPEEFAQFRPHLGTASGFQSVQWRVIELLAGLSADEEHMRRLRAMHGGHLPPVLAHAATEPTLRDAHHKTAHGPGSASQVVDLIGHIDTLLMRWRAEHLVMVQHKLGSNAVGTGGKTLTYLQATLTPAVPDAWGPGPVATAPQP